ncbi:hypothetical protein SNEBB_006257, partial [Seison nebaliae]
GQLGVMMWPDWHYGVLTMYSSHIAAHHLSCTTFNEIIEKSPTPTQQPSILLLQMRDLLDSGSASNAILSQHPLNQPSIHIHCWHTDEVFSKFSFRANPPNEKWKQILNQYRNTESYNLPAKIYALRMAYESENFTNVQLGSLLENLQYTPILL